MRAMIPKQKAVKHTIMKKKAASSQSNVAPEMMKVFYDSLSERPDGETQNTKHEYRKKKETFIC